MKLKLSALHLNGKIKCLDVKLDVNLVVKDKSRLYINELTSLFVEYIT